MTFNEYKEAIYNYCKSENLYVGFFKYPISTKCICISVHPMNGNAFGQLVIKKNTWKQVHDELIKIKPTLKSLENESEKEWIHGYL